MTASVNIRVDRSGYHIDGELHSILRGVNPKFADRWCNVSHLSATSGSGNPHAICETNVNVFSALSSSDVFGPFFFAEKTDTGSNFFTVIFSPADCENKSSGVHIHPRNFLLHSQISFAENHRDSGAKAIYIDGSKTDEGTGSAFCILENYGIIASWQNKLDHSNSVFQAEFFAIKVVSSLHRQIKIWTDSLSSLMAVLNPKSHHSMVREIQTLLLSHKHIHLRWLKAQVDHLGNECHHKRRPFLSTFSTFHFPSHFLAEI
ncbi:hypothetical protein AVEN_171495-1 [Araneus ventricosus]|uniref:RNase H type-1 domain-containing protein n=1 Tax=Araneus ventricosus TaxID=182803 RepID=A0A4Y2HB24_ARAVE|nr:hypothetical protein AVEN_171495-1 [Araneus ventricosus]